MAKWTPPLLSTLPSIPRQLPLFPSLRAFPRSLPPWGQAASLPCIPLSFFSFHESITRFSAAGQQSSHLAGLISSAGPAPGREGKSEDEVEKRAGGTGRGGGGGDEGDGGMASTRERREGGKEDGGGGDLKKIKGC